MASPRVASRMALRLTALSPIHLGTGHAVNWLEAIIDARSSTLKMIDTDRLNLSGALAGEFDALGATALNVSESDAVAFIGKVQEKLKKALPQARDAVRKEVRIFPKLAQSLDKLTGADRSRVAPAGNARVDTANEIRIDEIAANIRTGSPYIPGSAVKGAIRTAWLDHLRQSKGRPQNGEEYEVSLLSGKMEKDPFSRIALEDFHFATEPAYAVIVARNVKRQQRPASTRGGRPQTLQQSVVAILPAGQSASGAIRSVARAPGDGTTIQLDQALRACNDFHVAQWMQQAEALRAHVPEWWIGAMEKIVAHKRLGVGTAIVRLGKFATAESKTTRDRGITIRTGPKQSSVRDQGTTFWLASDKDVHGGLPFGWALLEWGEDETLSREMGTASEGDPVWARNAAPAVARPASETPGGAAIRTLTREFDARRGVEDLLRGTIREAKSWSVEDRAMLKKWALENLARAVPQKFKQDQLKRQIEEL